MSHPLSTELIKFRSTKERVQQRLDWEKAQVARIQMQMTAIETDKAQLLKAVALIDGTIAVISANGIGRIESSVTSGLQLVFADPTLSFVVSKKEGAKGNSYFFEVIQGSVRGPILETFGGGVANVVSFLLRVIVHKRFKLGKFFFVDEGFNNVSASRLPIVSDLLHSLTTDSGYTIFAVTHQPVLASAANHVYQVVPNAGAPPTLRLLGPGDIEDLMYPAPTDAIDPNIQGSLQAAHG